MQSLKQLPKSALIRVVVYIDALNFYYGALRGRPWKWLDLQKWASVVIPTGWRLERIHYFTSLVAGESQAAAARQAIYMRALAKWAARPEARAGQLRVHLGRRKMERIAGRVPGEERRTSVIVPKEKGTDVHLAARMVADAARNRFDFAVLVSNDSDFTECCKIVRGEFGKGVLLVPPLLNNRILSEELEAAVGGEHVLIVRPGPLEACQLPDVIPGTKIHRPPEW